ncbi:hypothetical protein ACO2Q9_09840 [Variovorax sp. VNK109]|uniref:hypothetical protein n=1 Tax=Variovorax sp. VNK109 TaxID=3400919 RepID=UPI003C01ACBF
MRRDHIQLRLLAKQGDLGARLKIGGLYLSGIEGLPRNIPMALEYLRGAGSPTPDAAVIVAEQLTLDEILEHGQLDALQIAAARSATAGNKLAVWQLLTGEQDRGIRLLEQSNEAGQQLLSLWRKLKGSSSALLGLMTQACHLYPMNTRVVALSAFAICKERGDQARMIDALAVSLHGEDAAEETIYKAVVDVVAMAELSGQPLGEIGISSVQAALEHQASHGNLSACYLLGRALAGIPCGSLPWQRLVGNTNFRKSSALLLRAADAGEATAWLHLYRISSDNRSSVANPQLARFCLEKAAACDIAEAQRRLGALLMREATTLTATERAIELLHAAADHGDRHAGFLMQSLVLPIDGDEDWAWASITELQATDPWLAMRLRLARHFGLTKQEALSVDPSAGKRDWGLVVGHNPFIAHARLASPRAIPATTPEALECLNAAATFFSSNNQDFSAIEGSLRKRSLSQRRTFKRMGWSDETYFATATSVERDALRLGSKWAHRSKDVLSIALSENPA